MLAVRWERSYVDDATHADNVISTLEMAEDMITTRLDDFGRNPDYKSELSEAEIERAIEEIRSTIEKYTK